MSLVEFTEVWQQPEVYSKRGVCSDVVVRMRDSSEGTAPISSDCLLFLELISLVSNTLDSPCFLIIQIQVSACPTIHSFLNTVPLTKRK